MAAHMTFQGAHHGQGRSHDGLSDLLRKVERPAVWLSGVAFSAGVWSLLIVALTHGR